MPNSRYVRGNRPRCRVTFKTLAGVGVDPSALIFRVQDPDGGEDLYTYGTDVEIVRDAAGEYHIDVPLGTLKQTTKYKCRWEARDADGLELAAAENVIETISDYEESN